MNRNAGTPDPVGDLLRLEDVPDDYYERLHHVREIARTAPEARLTHCPECGAEIDADTALVHAEQHYPRNIPAGQMSTEAFDREAALYRTAGRRVPGRS